MDLGCIPEKLFLTVGRNVRKYAFSIFGVFVDVCTFTFVIRIIFNSDNGGLQCSLKLSDDNETRLFIIPLL